MTPPALPRDIDCLYCGKGIPFSKVCPLCEKELPIVWWPHAEHRAAWESLVTGNDGTEYGRVAFVSLKGFDNFCDNPPPPGTINAISQRRKAQA